MHRVVTCIASVRCGAFDVIDHEQLPDSQVCNSNLGGACWIGRAGDFAIPWSSKKDRLCRSERRWTCWFNLPIRILLTRESIERQLS
jgi:hypothetical protein